MKNTFDSGMNGLG